MASAFGVPSTRALLAAMLLPLAVARVSTPPCGHHAVLGSAPRAAATARLREGPVRLPARSSRGPRRGPPYSALPPHSPGQSGAPVLFGATWLCFASFALVWGPGEANAPSDLALVEAIFKDPSACNALWYTIFNALGLMPAIVAALVLPGARGQRLPAWPFVVGSFALGYLAIGPYLALREPRPAVLRTDVSGMLAAALESRAAGVLLAAGAVGLPLFAGLQSIQDWPALTAEFVHLAGGSRLVSTSSLDLLILQLAAGSLCTEDALRRGWDRPGASLVALGAAAVPVVGPALWLALRPPLPEGA